MPARPAAAPRICAAPRRATVRTDGDAGPVTSIIHRARAAFRTGLHRDGWVAVAVGAALVLAGLAGFLVVLDAVGENDDLAELDQPVLEFLVAARSDPLTWILTAVTTVSGPVVLPIVVILACVVWAVRTRARWGPLLLAGSMAVATLVSLTLKVVVARPRPAVDSQLVPGAETTFSFPSGHTIGAATLLLVVGYLLWVRTPTWGSLVRWVAGVGAGVALVALSRLYLGYHFVTDVLASMALAVAVLGGVVVLDRRRAVRAARRTVA